MRLAAAPQYAFTPRNGASFERVGSKLARVSPISVANAAKYAAKSLILLIGGEGGIQRPFKGLTGPWTDRK